MASARIFLAEEALALKLIDKIGYLPEALKEAKNQAGLPENAKVVIYRRTASPDENIYSVASPGRNGETVANRPAPYRSVPDAAAGILLSLGPGPRGELTIVFTGIFVIPNAFIGDPVFLKKSLDSRSEALREYAL